MVLGSLPICICWPCVPSSIRRTRQPGCLSTRTHPTVLTCMSPLSACIGDVDGHSPQRPALLRRTDAMGNGPPTKPGSTANDSQCSAMFLSMMARAQCFVKASACRSLLRLWNGRETRPAGILREAPHTPGIHQGMVWVFPRQCLPRSFRPRLPGSLSAIANLGELSLVTWQK